VDKDCGSEMLMRERHWVCISVFMETEFYVLIGCRTATGFENIARFQLGRDRDFAYSVYRKLEGRTDSKETDSLTMQLVETKSGLPYNLKIISCTLDQLGTNCRMITKEIFKRGIDP
jgi:hypothetical protein